MGDGETPCHPGCPTLGLGPARLPGSVKGEGQEARVQGRAAQEEPPLAVAMGTESPGPVTDNNLLLGNLGEAWKLPTPPRAKQQGNLSP